MSNLEIYDQCKAFIGFTDADAANLQALAPLVAERGAGITDAFYTTLLANPETAALLEGRVEALKGTHHRWMAELVGGDYGEAYFENRFRIGMAHVRVNLPPHYVELVMSFLRDALLGAILETHDDNDVARARYGSLLKILDLDLIIINLAYGEERLERIVAVTGMSRRLIENLIKRGGKKKRG